MVVSRSEDARMLDPEDQESLPRFLSGQARHHGRQVWLHLLSTQRRWQLAPEWARIETEAAVLEQIGEDYRFLDRQSFSCQGLSFVISRFVHLRTDIPMHLIPGGRGVMGSETGEPGRFSDEGPPQQTLVPAMMIAQFPVTQRQWETIGGPDFRRFSDPERPIERVSWNDSKDWIRRAGGELRLPSEAEWEYACRAGSTTPYFFGASSDEIDQYAWYSQNSDRSTQKVGQKKPNAFGLHDIVWKRQRVVRGRLVGQLRG